MSEIEIIREKLILLITNYDKKIKHNLAIEAKYNNLLSEDISKTIIYQMQIKLFQAALAAAKDNKSIEMIQKIVDENKEQIKKQIIRQQLRLLSMERIIANSDKFSEADIKNLDNVYIDLIKNHHPAITLIHDIDIKKKYAIIRDLYLENTIDEFLKNDFVELGTFKDNKFTQEEALEEYKKAYQEFEEEYNRVSKYDEQFIELEKVIADDMLLARNNAKIREEIYKQKNELNKLAVEIKRVFDNKITF